MQPGSARRQRRDHPSVSVRFIARFHPATRLFRLLASMVGVNLASRCQRLDKLSSSNRRIALHQRQHRRAEGGRLPHHRPVNRKVDDVRQKLHQPVIRGHSAIDTDHRHRNAVAGDRGKQVVGLIGNRFQCGPNEVGGACIAGDAIDRAACIGDQCGAPSPVGLAPYRRHYCRASRWQWPRSRQLSMIFNPSRSHWTIAPETKIDPSSA